MAEIIISAANGNLTETPVASGLLADDDGPVTIDPVSLGESIPGAEGEAPIHSSCGYPLFAADGAPLHAAIVTDIPESDFSGYHVIGETEITIDWSASGIEDLDCCAYWADNAIAKIGWSYGHGSFADDDYKAWWTADNTGSGPEKIALLTTAARRSTKETAPYQYRIHLNFYGYNGHGTPTATVTVRFGAATLSRTISPATRSGAAATPSDPFVTITFAADGAPTSIL